MKHNNETSMEIEYINALRFKFQLSWNMAPRKRNVETKTELKFNNDKKKNYT